MKSERISKMKAKPSLVLSEHNVWCGYYFQNSSKMAFTFKFNECVIKLILAYKI